MAERLAALGVPWRQDRAAAHHDGQAGDELIPGYRLIEPLGEGGFGEVWKCEAPGGLHKAIKFVRKGDDGACPAAQEFAALQRVKSLRHPFILSLDRLEVIDGTLAVIMELADENLHDRFETCQAEGLPGIPRSELLAGLAEAADALDWMNFEHGLQHLDIKPHNLFLISGHVKVADFGLVQDLGDVEDGPRRQGGVTPLYSAPEMLRGSLSRSSDQYGLAVVYQQMLTGTVPFWHANLHDLMMMHLTGEPDLSRVPAGDHPALLRALSKVPDQRFASCGEFIQALASVPGQGSGVKRSGQWRRIFTGSRGEGKPLPSDQANPTTSTPGRLTPRGVGHMEHPRPALTETPTRRVRAVQRPDLPVPSGLEGRTGVMPVAYAPSGPNAPLPTAVLLPGFRFNRCVSQTPLGDLWDATDTEGRPRRALALLGYVQYDARLISHLQALRDPMLPTTEVHWSPAERLVVLTDPCEGTLRDRFEQCLANGQPGIPRKELLELLRTAAEVLDRLHARHGIQHLGLHPRNLLLDEGELRVADFGIIPLAWLPAGESVASINGRYAAPELFDRRPTPSADQYSLALMYAEMLTGVHPRPARPGSGSIRRPSGQRGSAPMRSLKIDLGLLPAHDRDVVARALAPNPTERFPTCMAFIEALQAAGAAPVQDLYGSLPPVIPYSTLMGEPPGPDFVLPEVPQLIVALIQPPVSAVDGPNNVKYRILPDGTWEYRCPMKVFPGAMDLKVAGFVCYWHARVLEHAGERYKLDFEVPGQKLSIWDVFRTQPRVEVLIDVVHGAGTRVTEAVVQVRYKGPTQEQSDRVLNHICPKVFDTVRTYFQAEQEQRGRERFPFTAPARIHPILPDLEMAETIEAKTRNISFGGMSLLAPTKPSVDHLYLHLHSSPSALGYALLGRMVRCQQVEGEWEIGVRFVER